MLRATYIVSGALLVAATVPLKSQDPAGIDMRFSAAEKTLSLGEPLIIEFRATNHFFLPITLDLGFNQEGAFTFDISTPDGTKLQVKAPKLESAGADVLVKIGKVPIGPGESYVQRIRLGEWYPFTKIGIYTITGRVGSVDNTFDITITDVDLARLRMICERLTAIALDPDSRGASDAALDLGFVRNRVAIPYLERLALSPLSFHRGAAIEGLGRVAVMAPVEATEVLVRIMEHGLDDEDRRRSAYILWSLAHAAK